MTRTMEKNAVDERGFSCVGAGVDISVEADVGLGVGENDNVGRDVGEFSNVEVSCDSLRISSDSMHAPDFIFST